MDQVATWGEGFAGSVTGSTRTDEELLRSIAGGNVGAMDQFYRRHAHRIYRFALARTSDEIAAQDVLGETMLKVWSEAGRFRAQSRPSTWWLGIAYHLAIDYMRTRYRRPTEPLDDEMPDPDATDASAALAAAQDAARVRAAIAKLSVDHRVVLHLAFFEDLGYERIAEILDCPVGTVKSRVFHAKQALKLRLSRPALDG
jgi:RNA polymerase sigma-70 factor (ECF subfamily)